ncbi:MAG: polyprenol monophosphomannose synthase [Mariniblastus sp.]|nr:polyprenol monophosphomannose synthase [Mariniblastus sp.]
MELTPKLLVVVATYNEIDNLPRLVHQIDELLPFADISVIDDSSPDGTGNWCERAVSKYPQLSVIHRDGKLGLGSAARVGFEIARNSDYDLVATLDADLSHEPRSLAEMVAKLCEPQNHAIGVMIGSRYIEGGGTEGWPLIRKVGSRAVNLFARLMLGLKTKDNSGAFRVYRADALGLIDLSQLRSNDLAYLEEILWRLKKANVKFAEHPIVFKNRELGRSKTNAFLGLHVFWQIAKMGLGIWK